MTDQPGPPSSILSEGYAGLENQALGLGEAAGLTPATCRIAPRGVWARLPARFWPAPLSAVDGLETLGDGLLLSAGGTAGAVAASLRRRDRRAVVQVQNPRMPLDRFDLVVANRHDEIAGPNVISTRTALHRITPARLAGADADWRPVLRPFAAGRPLLAVLLGGSNGRLRLDQPTARRLAADLARIVADQGVAVAVTPSRRTPPDALAALRQAVPPEHAWIWDGGGANPYVGLLACADAILVTADSISMVSEAVATRAPVMVAGLPGRSRRIGLFLDALRASGRIRFFRGRLERFDAQPLDDTPEAGQEMRRRIGF